MSVSSSPVGLRITLIGNWVGCRLLALSEHATTAFILLPGKADIT
jgi:hypothetical protein